MRPMRRLSCCCCCPCADRQFLVKVAGKGVLARTPLVVTLWLLPKWWGRAIYENRAQDDAKIYFLPPTSFLRNSIGNQTQSNSIFLRLLRVLFLRNQSRVKPTYSISNTGFDHSLTLYLSFIAKSSIAQDLLIVNFINVATVPSGSG